jgi:hypothetical protein
MYMGLEDHPTGGEAVVRRSIATGVLYRVRDLFEAERSSGAICRTPDARSALAETLGVRLQRR